MARIVPLVPLAALVLVAAACGGGSSGAAAGGSTAASSSTAAGVTVQLRDTDLGPVLVDGSGRTLYLYTPDGNGAPTCNGSCASAWPPLVTSGQPAAGTGVKASLLGTATRSDGSLQVTYAGHPLYRYSGDSAAGQTNGENFGGIWFAVSATGAKVEPGTTPTTTSSGYGSGY